MTPFYICGGILAGWALLVTLVGVTRPGFPGTKGAATVVGFISVALAATAVGTAIYCSATTEHEAGESHGGEEQGSVPAAAARPA